MNLELVFSLFSTLDTFLPIFLSSWDYSDPNETRIRVYRIDTLIFSSKFEFFFSKKHRFYDICGNSILYNLNVIFMKLYFFPLYFGLDIFHDWTFFQRYGNKNVAIFDVPLFISLMLQSFRISIQSISDLKKCIHLPCIYSYSPCNGNSWLVIPPLAWLLA